MSDKTFGGKGNFGGNNPNMKQPQQQTRPDLNNRSSDQRPPQQQTPRPATGSWGTTSGGGTHTGKHDKNK